MGAVYNPNDYESGVPDFGIEPIEVLPDVAYQSDRYYTAPRGNVISSQPATGGEVGDFFGSISRTANNLIDFYGKVASIEAQADNARYNRQISAAQLDLNKTQVLGNIEVAKTRSGAEIQIAQAQAQAAAREAQRLATSSGGAIQTVTRTVSDNRVAIAIGIAGLMIAWLQYSKGRA